MNCRTLRVIQTTIAALCSLTACTSEPLVSRKGVSGVAVGEVGIEALLAIAALGGGASVPDHFGNFDISDHVYIAGIIPVKKPNAGGRRIDNGTRLFVDGRKRGSLPQVLKVRKPGPHVVRVQIPAFQPYDITLSETTELRIGDNTVEAWPPVIVDSLSGEIFTTRNTSAVNPERNSGRKPADLAEKVGKTPLLIVTTTDKKHPGWRKIGQLRPKWMH